MAASVRIEDEAFSDRRYAAPERLIAADRGQGQSRPIATTGAICTWCGLEPAIPGRAVHGWATCGSCCTPGARVDGYQARLERTAERMQGRRGARAAVPA